MFIGAYICASGFVFLIGLAGLALSDGGSSAGVLGKRWLSYVIFTLPLIGLILFVFMSLSISTGLMVFGGPQDWSYPRDYLAYGPAGWILMAIPIFGILSPFLVMIAMARRLNDKKEPTNGINF
jgi:hypothetical protein